MSVVYGGRLPDSGEMTKRKDGTKTYTEKWRVKVDDYNDGPITVLSWASLPQIGDTYAVDNDTDTSAIVTSLRPRRSREDRYFWDIEVTYEYKRSTSGFSGQGGDVTLQLPEISGNTLPYTKPATKTWDGNKGILNSVNMPFDPPPEMDAARQAIQWSRYVSTCPAARAWKYINKINADVLWAGEPWQVDKFCAKVADFSFNREVQVLSDTPEFVWKETIVLHIQDEPWVLSIEDRGLYEAVFGYDPETGSDDAIVGRKRITINGQPIDHPVLLNGHGRKLSDNAKEPVFLDFEVYQPLPLSPASALNVPDLNPDFI